MTKKEENLKTRPDLTDDREWLAWLRLQPENKGIEVADLYRKMLLWCKQKGVIPTRLRLLKWLETERAAVPMTYEPAYLNDTSASADNCSNCNNERRIIVNDFRSPCPRCRPTEEKAFWRARGR